MNQKKLKLMDRNMKLQISRLLDKPRIIFFIDMFYIQRFCELFDLMNVKINSNQCSKNQTETEIKVKSIEGNKCYDALSHIPRK